MSLERGALARARRQGTAGAARCRRPRGPPLLLTDDRLPEFGGVVSGQPEVRRPAQEDQQAQQAAQARHSARRLPPSFKGTAAGPQARRRRRRPRAARGRGQGRSSAAGASGKRSPRARGGCGTGVGSPGGVVLTPAKSFLRVGHPLSCSRRARSAAPGEATESAGRAPGGLRVLRSSLSPVLSMRSWVTLD